MNGKIENSALRSVLEVQHSSAVSLTDTADSQSDELHETSTEKIIIPKPVKNYSTVFRHNANTQNMIKTLMKERDTTISELMRGLIKKEHEIFQKRKQGAKS
jgi:hypothetical protein